MLQYYEKFREWLEDHTEGFFAFILILFSTMLFVLLYSSSSLFKGIACSVLIGTYSISLLLEIIDDCFLETQQSTSDFESDLCSGCLECKESKEDSYKRKRHKIRDMLKEYKEKTDVKEVKQLRKM